jgi:hypothetical protein
MKRQFVEAKPTFSFQTILENDTLTKEIASCLCCFEKFSFALAFERLNELGFGEFDVLQNEKNPSQILALASKVGFPFFIQDEQFGKILNSVLLDEEGWFFDDSDDLDVEDYIYDQFVEQTDKARFISQKTGHKFQLRFHDGHCPPCLLSVHNLSTGTLELRGGEDLIPIPEPKYVLQNIEQVADDLDCDEKVRLLLDREGKIVLWLYYGTEFYAVDMDISKKINDLINEKVVFIAVKDEYSYEAKTSSGKKIELTPKDDSTILIVSDGAKLYSSIELNEF